MGIYFAERGDFIRALDYFLNSLKIFETINDERRIGVALGAIARIYNRLEDYENALKYDLKAVDLAIKTKDSTNLPTTYNNVGNDYNNLKDYQAAIESFEKALNLAYTNKKLRLVALLHTSIGSIYLKQETYLKAKENLETATKLYIQINDSYGQSLAFNYLSEYYYSINLNDSAIIYANKALLISKLSGNIIILQKSTELLYKSYDRNSNPDSAYKYLNEFNQLHDSILNKSNIQEITQLQARYEFEKEQAILDFKHKTEVRRQKTFTYFFIIAFVLALLLIIFVFISYRLKKKSEENLKQLNATKDKFFRIISHDLKGPFNAFISISEVLANPELNLSKDKIMYFAKSINKTATGAFSLFQNLLKWSASQRGNLQINIIEVNLHNVTNETIGLLSSNALNKNLSIVNNINSKLLVNTDIDIIQTILRNLISNAIKYSKEHGKIIVEAKSNINNTEVSVKDTGIGIKPENLTKLFQLDTHFSTKGTNNETGTGLGLILCKELIDKINGTIRVTSKINVGTEFTLSI